MVESGAREGFRGPRFSWSFRSGLPIRTGYEFLRALRIAWTAKDPDRLPAFSVANLMNGQMSLEPDSDYSIWEIVLAGRTGLCATGRPMAGALH